MKSVYRYNNKYRGSRQKILNMFKEQTDGQCDWRLVKGIRVEGDEIGDIGLRVWVFF